MRRITQTHPTLPLSTTTVRTATQNHRLVSSPLPSGSAWDGVRGPSNAARSSRGVVASASSRSVVPLKSTSLGLRGLATVATSSSSTAPETAPLPLFNKILIANRGEIACRVMRTCRRLGIKTVAVYSEVDVNSMHVKMADEAYYIGPAASSESYLRKEAYVELCKKTGAQAVHPGYGFLSENADFAQLLADNGIVFIGPPPSAITSMGSKAESKEIMIAAGVPCIPGWHPDASSPSDCQTPAFLLARAEEIQWPVMIKAVSGGGGKGMKIATKREEFESQLESAKREARKHFGSDDVLLEKYVSKSRHVEVQIFSDAHDNHISLFERDCSVQRRHQKIIEEAPAPGLAPELREKLYDEARKAAKAVGYRGAGTVEFVLNAEDLTSFYFLEVNTRLQVEHCVSEEITGLDFVELQLQVAAGNPLPIKQEQVVCTGHAFECRIYAENPRNNFLPDAGHLLHHRPPTASANVRIETGFESGDTVSVSYDPMIAKLIVSGTDRTAALRSLRKALNEYQIVGPSTNLEFLSRLAADEAFIAGEVDTGFISKHYDDLFPPLSSASPASIAAAALYLSNRDFSHYTSLGHQSAWTSPKLAGFRLGGVEANRYERRFELGGKDEEVVQVSVAPSMGATGALDVSVSDNAGQESVLFSNLAFSTSTSTSSNPAATTVKTSLPSHRVEVDIVSSPAPPLPLTVEQQPEVLTIFNTAEGFAGKVEVKPPAWMAKVGTAVGEAGKGKGAGGVVAPMPSKVVQVFVKAGDVVAEGAPLVMLEAMKTEHVLRASVAGTVAAVKVNDGDLVPSGKVLVEFEVVEEEAAEGEKK